MTLRSGFFAALLVLVFSVFSLFWSPSAMAQTNLCTSQNTGTTVTYNIFSNCHTVTNNTGATICVFTGTSGEWSTFTASATPWSGVSVGSCSCSGTPCGTIANGGTCTVYASSTPAGACTSSTITCTNGSTSGGSGYTATSCTAGCSATTTTWNTSCSGSVAAATAGGTQTVTNTAGGYTGSETATCNAGGSGAFAYSGASCASSGVSCTYPWGGTLSSGSSASTGKYLRTSVVDQTYCATFPTCYSYALTATCTNGTLTCADNYGDSDPGCATYYSSCTDLPCGCFLPNTPILMADGSHKAVSDLKTGDAVQGQTTVNRVSDVKINHKQNMVYGFNGGDAFVTGGHPFFTLAGWKAINPDETPVEGHDIEVSKLAVGDIIVTETGQQVTIRSIDAHPARDQKTFNPILDGDHTYYANGFLVHNKALCSTSCGLGCFIGSVKILMADGSQKPVAELQVGDQVMGQNGAHKVDRILVRTSDEPLYRINNSMTAFVTAEHIFYTTDGLKSIDPELTFKEDKTHIRVNKLNVGDVLFDDHGNGIRITSIEKVEGGEHTLYNPEFDKDHSYYADGYLVHNPLK